MCLKLQLGATLEFKALSPVPPALAGDAHVHFILYLGTTGKINGNKGEYMGIKEGSSLPAVRQGLAAWLMILGKLLGSSAFPTSTCALTPGM